MKKIISIVMLILIMPFAFANGDNWLLHFAQGTAKINATDFCTSTGSCLSQAGGSYSWTVAGNSGSSAVASGNTVTIKGGNNITTSLSGTTLTIGYNGSVGSGSADGAGFLTADGRWVYNSTSGLTVNLTTANATYCKLTDFNGLQGNVSTINTTGNIQGFITQAFITALGFDISTTIKGWISTNSTADRLYSDTNINNNFTTLNARIGAVNTSDNIAALFSNDFHNIGGNDLVNSTSDIRSAINNSGAYNISVPWNNFVNPTKNADISMGTYNTTFRLGNSAGGFLFNYQGAFTGHGFEVLQNVGNPMAGTHLVHIEAADNDVLPLHVTHSGNPTEGVAVFEGKVNITGNITNSGACWMWSNSTCMVRQCGSTQDIICV